MAATVDTQLGITRKRLQDLYKFLIGFAHLRYPVVRQVEQLDFRLWLDDLPEHSSIERGWLDDEADFALRVTRPLLTSCPEPPELLRGWLQRGWGRS